MTKKNHLNEVVSSSPAPNRDTNSNSSGDKSKAGEGKTPAFLEDYLHQYYHHCYNHDGRDDEEDESQDKRRGLFRNRLFSTWRTSQQKAVTLNDRKTKIDGCDIIQVGLSKEALNKRDSSSSNNNYKRQSIRSSKEIDDDEEEERADDEDVDGGYAWIILIVMFIINASTFGTARAYGLIFENSARRDEQSRSDAALPFTIMGAVENMAGPLTGYLLGRTKSWRVMVFLGSCLITLSHLLAACFDTQLGQILTIGLMCGLGQSFITISSFQINNAYFVRYRSRAFGIGLTGAAVGTFYISPLCQFVLDNYTKSLCYLMLGFILFPNVPLSLLLKPKGNHLIHISSGGGIDDDRKFIQPRQEVDSTTTTTTTLTAAVAAAASNQPPEQQTAECASKSTVFSISNQLICQQEVLKEAKKENETSFLLKAKQVLATPLFHLIWPTQLLFCWLNFVFGMIITDFGKDRGLNETQNSHLIVIWASGQLFGRLCLGSLVDLRILSYKSFTMICFASISLITFMLNEFGTADRADQSRELASNLICLLVFILSMFISTLYILFNGLIFNYMDKSLTALSIGISSFTGSFFLLPRATIIGYYRDTCGNYDSMLTMFTWVTMISALVWLIVPCLRSYVRRSLLNRSTGSGGVSQVNELLDDCSISSDMISKNARPDVIR